jgi:hypothetical protein
LWWPPPAFARAAQVGDDEAIAVLRDAVRDPSSGRRTARL